MKKILYLTNPDNGAFEEDTYLIALLKSKFDLIVSHPLECEQYLPLVQGIVIRNIWPTRDYLVEWKKIKDLIKKSHIPTYNPLVAKGDNQGKDYLVELYKQGFPVIPSIDNLDKIDQLPDSDYFWVKPKVGCDGWGAKKLLKEDLFKSKLEGYIIQPYIDFVSEPSFFFINNKFVYSIEMPNRLRDANIKSHEPNNDELLFAEKFVRWNDLSYGIQRIDAVRNKMGELLLTEVEDIAEYLYIFDIDQAKREHVANILIDSMVKNL